MVHVLVRAIAPATIPLIQFVERMTSRMIMLAKLNARESIECVIPI